MAGKDPTTVELDGNEVALILSEEGGEVSVRVAAAADIAADPDSAPEIALALAARLVNDPDFHDDVMDWYYAYLEKSEDDDEEEDED